MFTVEKTFTADLAHRVHTQKLDSDFTENNSKILKCRGLHGHTVSILIRLASAELVNNMVLDYNEIGWFKTLINDILDHKTLLSLDDPIYKKAIVPLIQNYCTNVDLISTTWSSGKFNSYKINLSNCEDQDIYELLNSITLIDFASTSENLAEFLHSIVAERINAFNNANNTNVRVHSVSYKETPSSTAVFIPNL